MTNRIVRACAECPSAKLQDFSPPENGVQNTSHPKKKRRPQVESFRTDKSANEGPERKSDDRNSMEDR